MAAMKYSPIENGGRGPYGSHEILPNKKTDRFFAMPSFPTNSRQASARG